MTASDFFGRASFEIARSAADQQLTGAVVGVRYAPPSWWSWWRLWATSDWSHVEVAIDGVRCSPAIRQGRCEESSPIFVELRPGRHTVEVRSLLGAEFETGVVDVAPLARYTFVLEPHTIRALGFIPDRAPTLQLHPFKRVLDREFAGRVARPPKNPQLGPTGGLHE